MPFVADDGYVRGDITSRRVTRWRVVKTFPGSPTPSKAPPPPYPYNWSPPESSPATWIVRLDQVIGINTVIFNELTSDHGFPAYRLEAWSDITP